MIRSPSSCFLHRRVPERDRLIAVLHLMAIVASPAAAQIRGLPYFYDVLGARQNWSVGLVVAGAIRSDEDLPADQQEDWIVAGSLRRRMSPTFTVAGSAGAVFDEGTVWHFGLQLDRVVYNPVYWSISLIGGGAVATRPADRTDQEDAWSVDSGVGIGVRWSFLPSLTALQLWVVPRYANRVSAVDGERALQHGASTSAGIGAYTDRLGLSLGMDVGYLDSETAGNVALRDGVEVRIGVMARIGF